MRAMGLFGCCRRRGGGTGTAKETAAETPTANAAPCEDVPGEYLLVKAAVVRREVSLESAKVGELKVGSSVTVAEVVCLAAKRKIRGRILEPSGWITLRDEASDEVVATRWMRSPDASSLKAGHALLAMSKLTMRLDERLDSACVAQLPEDEPLEVLQVGAGRRIQVKAASGRVGWVSLRTDDGVPLTKQRIPVDAEVAAEKGKPVAGRWLRGVWLPDGLASGFCGALRSEFVDGAERATSRWLERPEVPEHVRAALRPEVKTVAAGTSPSRRAESVAALAVRWGLPAHAASEAGAGGVEPVSVVIHAAVDEVGVEQEKPAAPPTVPVVLQRDGATELHADVAICDDGTSAERIEPIKPLREIGKGDGKFAAPTISSLEEVLPPTLDDDIPPKQRDVANARQSWCILCCH